jgi:lactoylglutathione lyase
MMIEHVAIWTNQLEELREFYEAYFSALAGEKYTNEKKGFESYFFTFPSGGTRLELMRVPTLSDSRTVTQAPHIGYVHLAISLGTQERVDALTSRLRSAGIIILDGPRYTGDGYYESVVLDPDGNRVEITI